MMKMMYRWPWYYFLIDEDDVSMAMFDYYCLGDVAMAMAMVTNLVVSTVP